MTKNQKLAVGISSSFLVVVLVTLSLVSSAALPKAGGGTAVSQGPEVCRVPITVLSPNGGEFYQAGEKITVTWKTCENIPASALIRIELQAWGIFPAYLLVNTLNDGSELVTLPTTTTLPGMQYGLGYKVAATYIPKIISPGQVFYRDFSDNLFTINAVCTPNTWTQKANLMGKARWEAVGFSIGSKGYVGTGDDGAGNRLKDFWEYDPTLNTWTQKSDFGGVGRSSAEGFSIGSKGYIGIGSIQPDPTLPNVALKDFWEYDPSLNTWTKKADFGGGERAGAASFVVGNKGYIGTGISGFNDFQDFWEYDPSLNTWTKKADFGGGHKWQATGFSIGSKGYIASHGEDINDESTAQLWEYSPATNIWTRKADFIGKGLSLSAIAFSIGDKGYAGIGNDTRVFKQYDPVTNQWNSKKVFTGEERRGAVGFSIGNRGYVGAGNGQQRDFWEYCPG